MDGVMAKASMVGFLMRRGRPREIAGMARRFWQSEVQYLGFKREMSVPFTAPSARIPLTVGKLQLSDVATLLDTRDPALDPDEKIVRLWQRKLVTAGLETCYVARTPAGVPCYMQFLIGPVELPRAIAFYGDQFPKLGPGEVILEGAFTPAEFRGQGIMPAAMAQISEAAARNGAKTLITFVANDNVPALKGCRRAGYSPYVARTRRWTHFRRSFSSSSLLEGTPDRPEPVTAA